MNKNIIVVNNLVKQYEKNKLALDGMINQKRFNIWTVAQMERKNTYKHIGWSC